MDGSGRRTEISAGAQRENPVISRHLCGSQRQDEIFGGRKSRADEREDKGAAERRIACCHFVAKGIREPVGRPGFNDCSGWRGGIRARAKSNSMEIVTSANFPRSSSWSEADMACFITPQVDVSCPADPHAQRHTVSLSSQNAVSFFARVDKHFPTYRH